MAYNYPMSYQPMYPNAFPTQMNVAPTQPTQSSNTNGLVPVRNENEARNYPVAYGNSITFKDENAPYIYVKTMGFSQLDRPMFEKFRLVREENVAVASSEPHSAVPSTEAIDKSISEMKAEIGQIWGEIKAIKGEVKSDGE